MRFLKGFLLVVSVLLSVEAVAQEQVDELHPREGNVVAKEAGSYYDIEYVVGLPPVVKVTKYASGTGLKQRVFSYEAAAYKEGRGVKEGEQLWYDKTGQLVLKVRYTNNLLNDSLFAYYDSGKIRRIEVYKKGVMTEGKVFAEDSTLLPYQPRDRMPEFPGGDLAMFKYIDKKVRYPKAARKDKASGTVTVEFIVGEDGIVRDATILSGVHPALDAEAIRVIKAMPVWEPGIQEDKPIKFSYRLPIKFSSN